MEKVVNPVRGLCSLRGQAPRPKMAVGERLLNGIFYGRNKNEELGGDGTALGYCRADYCHA